MANRTKVFLLLNVKKYIIEKLLCYTSEIKKR